MPAKPSVWAGVTALWFTTLPVHAQPIAGAVEYVVDGDTLMVVGETVRLWGIDAPELRQTCTRAGESYPCGQVARYVLLSFVKGRTITCQERDRDRYRRIVASCQVAGRDLGELMVSAGQAVDYTRYSKAAYAEAERTARRDGKGLWAGSFVDPGEWRQRK